MTEKLGYKNAPHHLKIYKALQDPTIQNLLIVMPPRHGKSTCVSVNYLLYELGNNPDLRVAITSYGQNFSSKFIREITGWMAHPDYIEIFGDLKPKKTDSAMKKWGQDEIVIAGRTRPMKEASIIALGVNSGIIGQGFDIIIVDDPQDEESANSEVQRDNLERWFDKELLSRREPNCRVIVVMTRWNFLDLANRLMKMKNSKGEAIWTVLHLPAIDENNKPLWEDKYPLEVLLKRKEDMGSVAFGCVYQGDPIESGGKIFQLKWLHYYDPQIDDPVHKIHKLPPREQLRIYQGWDLAISEEPTAHYTVGLTIGISADFHVYLLDYVRGKWDFPTQKAQVKAQYLSWKPIKVGIESVAYQKALQQDVRPMGIPAVEIKKPSSKELDMNHIAPYFENGTIVVNKNDTNFLNEYLRFPTKGATDDILDALVCAFRTAPLSKSQVGGIKKKFG